MQDLGVGGVVAVLLLTTAGMVFAGSDSNFNDQLKAELQCNSVGATSVIDVTQKVLDDRDDGVAGNVWAKDNYKREIKVWQLAAGSFCATVKYEGSFVTVAGQSPQNTGTVSAGIEGELKGGYRSTIFTGTLLTNPLAPTDGFIGTYNYNCNGTFVCPGYVDWRTLFFSSTSGFDFAWWGWAYDAEDHGTWVNAITGNIGDITG